MVEVLPLPPHFLVGLRQQHDRLASAITATLPARHAALRGLQRAFGFPVPAGLENARAIRERGKSFNPQVYPRLLPGGRKGLYGDVRAGDACVPAVRLFGDRGRLRPAFQGTRPAHGDAPDLGEDQEAVVYARAAVVSHLWKGERIVA